MKIHKLYDKLNLIIQLSKKELLEKTQNNDDNNLGLMRPLAPKKFSKGCLSLLIIFIKI